MQAFNLIKVVAFQKHNITKIIYLTIPTIKIMKTAFITDINDIIGEETPTAPQANTAPAAVVEGEPAAATEPNKEGSPATEETKLSPKMLEQAAKASSKFFVRMIDGGQRLLFTSIGNRKLKNRLEIIGGDEYEYKVQAAVQKLDVDIENRENGSQTTHSYTKEEKIMLANVAKFEAFIEELPFTDDEREEMIECLTIIAQSRGGSLPPEYIAGGTIALSLINRGIKLYGL